MRFLIQYFRYRYGGVFREAYGDGAIVTVYGRMYRGLAGVKKLKLYLETTVFNYYLDTEREYHEDTVRLFTAVGAGDYEAYTSEYVAIELRNAQEPKRSKMLALIDEYGITVFGFDEESTRLANLYVQDSVIPERFRFDAAHIAVATIHGLDCVVSFNFQHINRLKTKNMTAFINLNEGYKPITICTPMEVF
jgi:predicted nucleic acid-binding protein